MTFRQHAVAFFGPGGCWPAPVQTRSGDSTISKNRKRTGIGQPGPAAATWLPVAGTRLSIAVSALFAGACGGDPTSPAPDPEPAVSRMAVLASETGTIEQFYFTDSTLVKWGSTYNLPAGLRAEGMDGLQDLWVVAGDNPAGDQIVFGAFSDGEMVVSTFPDPAVDFNPTRATVVTAVDLSGGGIVWSLSLNRRFVAFPDGTAPRPLPGSGGVHVARLLTWGNFFVSIDANLDDSLPVPQPIGSTRIRLDWVHDGSTLDEFGVPDMVGAVDGFILNDELTVVGTGDVDPVTGNPVGNGSLAVVNLPGQEILTTHDLEGNGVHFEAGLDRVFWVVRTTTPGSWRDTDLLSYDVFRRSWHRGPANPVTPQDENGDRVNCRFATALLDGRLICGTDNAAGSDRLYMLTEDGQYMHHVSVGAGLTDIILR